MNSDCAINQIHVLRVSAMSNIFKQMRSDGVVKIFKELNTAHL